MQNKKWVRLLAYVTGLVNQELLLQNEYLAAGNRILRSHLPARLRLSDPERSTLVEIGKRLGRRGLERVAGVAQPETILAWYHRLIARKFDGSKRRSYPGRPPLDGKTEALIVRMARENSGWGYDRIVGALANLGHRVSDQRVANVRRRYGIAPAPKRCQKTTWNEFISAHLAVLAGVDLFTVEVLTGRGLAQPVRGLIEQINPILRGWVNYFAVGHSSRCFSYIRDWVEKKIRCHLARARQRPGFGWKRWRKEWLYGTLGLFHEYRVVHQPSSWAAASTRSAP